MIGMNEWPPEREPEEGSPAARLKEERLYHHFDVKGLCAELDGHGRPNISAKRYVWIECGHTDLLSTFKTAHWMILSQLGFDIQYIMTGIPSRIRDPKEAALVENYRRCSAENQQHLEAVSTAFKEQEPQPKWLDTAEYE